MNCKPGDMAVIVASPIYEWLIGRFVEVLYQAPSGEEFRLPDGCLHAAIQSQRHYWVCKFQSPIAAPMGRILPRMTLYAPIPDEVLRPIRDPGVDAQDETLQWLPSPAREGVTA